MTHPKVPPGVKLFDDEPRTLPQAYHRPRALTAPLPGIEKSIIPSPSHGSTVSNPMGESNGSNASQPTLPQDQTGLFKLPVEIREIIWKHLLSGHLFHLAQKPDKLLAIGCTDQDLYSAIETERHQCWGRKRPGRGAAVVSGASSRDTPDPTYYGRQLVHPARPIKVVNLLRLCRRIYSELIDLLYSSNTFDLKHVETFLSFSRLILPQRLARIRTLRLTWTFGTVVPSKLNPYNYDIPTWQQVCAVLTSMRDLDELLLMLDGTPFSPRDLRYNSSNWVKPLDLLRDVKPWTRFDVYVYWKEKDCTAIAAKLDYPFKLLPRPRDAPTEPIFRDLADMYWYREEHHSGPSGHSCSGHPDLSGMYLASLAKKRRWL